MTDHSFPVLEPDLQVSFHYKLQTIRRLHLREALSSTIGKLDITQIDAELGGYVDAQALRQVATFGIRGEVVFAIPLVLRANPHLLGYYRLLLGFSQKEFYHKGPFGRFKTLEEDGVIPRRVCGSVQPICKSLIRSATKLVGSMQQLSAEIVHELQILTLGAQLRGGENTRIGQKAAKDVRDVILGIVKGYVQDETQKAIVLRNASDRVVLIEFFADPDVRVTEQLPSGVQPTLSIEIKGGTDASNIHNRLGEAEKSHQKARNRGFREFWTIISVDLEDAAARQASPTTSGCEKGFSHQP